MFIFKMPIVFYCVLIDAYIHNIAVGGSSYKSKIPHSSTKSEIITNHPSWWDLIIKFCEKLFTLIAKIFLITHCFNFLAYMWTLIIFMLWMVLLYDFCWGTTMNAQLQEMYAANEPQLGGEVLYLRSSEPQTIG